MSTQTRSKVEPLPERELDRIEARQSPDDVRMLVDTVRQQQREIDSLRASVDVLQRDREELRRALLNRSAEGASDSDQ